jgi:hypothetical protein
VTPSAASRRRPEVDLFSYLEVGPTMLTPQFEIDIPESIVANWQEICDILADLFAIPAALIMRLASPHIEVFVASRSGGNPYHSGDREEIQDSGLYCERVIATQDRLLVPDALADPEWKDNPDVRLNMISYLGFPIRLPNGEPFGTICVLDRKRNEYSANLERLMQKFRGLIESHIEILYMNQSLGDKNRRLVDYLMELQALRGLVPICANCKSIKDDEGNWQPIEHFLVRHPEADFSHGICPKCMKELYPDFPDPG